MEIHIGERGARYAANNVANRPLEFSISIARESLRPSYGQGFRGAPLQTDTEGQRSQTVRLGGRRAKSKQTRSDTSGGAEHV
jgi:hypothetical protein